MPDEWWGPFAVWEGGLGIWGGIAGGVAAGAIVAKRSGASVFALMDAAAPGLLVAQAIGRVGNWWNQELFGKPTDAAWGLEIDPARRPDEYLLESTFHPTFLYEGLWNLAAAALLLILDRFYRFKPPALFALYVALYSGFRFFLEQLRVDPSKELLGTALERVGLPRGLRRRRRLLRLVAVLPRRPPPAPVSGAQAGAAAHHGDPARPRPIASLA